MDPKTVVAYWVGEAEHDIPVAEHLLTAGDFLYSLFLCQLFVEKALKALVVGVTGEHAPPIHNLVVLADRAGLGEDWDGRDLLRELMRFSIDARYPRDRDAMRSTYGREYATTKLNESRRLAEWLCNKATSSTK